LFKSENDLYDKIYQTAVLIFFNFKERTKLPNEATEMTGCVFCSPDFSNLVEKHRAINRPNRALPGGRAARGRGRGRGGKGRGKGKPKDKMAQLAAYFV
jgi:DNA topoisomerase III